MHPRLAVAIVAGSCLTAATILWAGSYPAGGLVAGLVAVGLLLITGVAWVVLVMLELTRRVPGSRRRRLALIAITTAAAVVFIGGSAAICRLELALLARFSLAQPAFDRAVAERTAAARAAEGQPPCPARIRTYRISACRTVGADSYFTEPDAGLLNSAGFAYLPAGPPANPPAVSPITYHQLRGQWYWYVETW